MTSLRRLLVALVFSSSLGGTLHPAWAAPIDQGPASVAADTGPPLAGTRRLVAAFGGVAVLLGLAMYLLPVRTAAVTRRRIEAVMMERALTLQEEDRRHIARELHDGAGQALTAARLQLMVLRDGGCDPAAVDREAHSAAVIDREARSAAVIDRIIKSVDEAIDEVRRSTSALAPPALAELGLAGALERHCEALALVSNMAVRCEVPGRLPQMEAYVERTCYRIAQEALHNASRHAGAKLAWIRLGATDTELRLDIGDDGVGLGEERSRGFGLASIRDRVRLAGGTVQVLDGKGPGTRISVTLPVGRPAPRAARSDTPAPRASRSTGRAA